VHALILLYSRRREAIRSTGGTGDDFLVVNGGSHRRCLAPTANLIIDNTSDVNALEAAWGMTLSITTAAGSISSPTRGMPVVFQNV
jgi:hypothetical protein